MSQHRIVAASCLFVLLNVGLASVVLAQTEVETVPLFDTLEAPSTEEIFQREGVKSDIEEQHVVLKGQYEEYREAERQFSLAKNQLSSLGTLTSLEKAIQATREVLDKRDQLLITYVTLVKLTLTDTTGVNVSDKTATLADLDALLAALRTHKEHVAAVKDRPQLAAVVAEFTALGKPMEQTLYRGLVWISVGQMQAVVDKLVATVPQVENEAAQTAATPTQEAERQRALRETKLLIERATTTMKGVTAEVRGKDGKPISYKSVYSKVFRELGSVYADVGRSLTFLDEVLRI